MQSLFQRIAVAVTIVAAAPAWADGEWPGLRGPGARGVAADHTRLPAEWSATKNVLWKVELEGRGWSSPIVWGNRVFLTSAITSEPLDDPRKGLYFGGNREQPPKTEICWIVTCLDANTGMTLWETQVARGLPPGPIHLKNSYASETPVTDGERVYAAFGNVGIFCLDSAGNRVWEHRRLQR